MTRERGGRESTRPGQASTHSIRPAERPPPASCRLAGPANPRRRRATAVGPSWVLEHWPPGAWLRFNHFPFFSLARPPANFRYTITARPHRGLESISPPPPHPPFHLRPRPRLASSTQTPPSDAWWSPLPGKSLHCAVACILAQPHRPPRLSPHRNPPSILAHAHRDTPPAALSTPSDA